MKVLDTFDLVKLNYIVEDRFWALISGVIPN